MTFNTEINALRAMLARENDRVAASGGCFAASEAIREIDHQICTLTDREITSPDTFRAEVLRMTYTHDPAHFIVTPRNKSEELRIGKIRSAFAAQLDRVLAGELSGDVPVLPYRRVLTGEEAKTVQARFASVWHYDGDYWYPLNRLPDGMRGNVLFLMEQHVTPHMDALLPLLGLPERPVYRAKEYDPDGYFFELTGEFTPYWGSEWAYTDTDFSWMIYFSHEGSVSFAGSIVEAAKELFRDEAAYFDKWFDDERDFNAEINDLRVTLMREAERYQDKGSRFARDLDTRLCTMTDRTSTPDLFPSIVNGLLTDYEKRTQGTLQNQAEAYILKHITNALRARADKLAKDGVCDGVPLLPYRRVIEGTEAEAVIGRLRAELYPLVDRTPDGTGSGLWMPKEYVLPHMDALSRLMGLPDRPVYKRIECDPLIDFCEMIGVLEPDSHETAYAPADFSYLVLFSMEGVVHFEGAIVGAVRELLRDEAEHFNR